MYELAEVGFKSVRHDVRILAQFAIAIREEANAQEVQAQALASPPRKTDRGSTAACYKLSDDGIELFRTGILGAPEGFKEWPSEVPEPDFDIYPLTENAVLAIHHGN